VAVARWAARCAAALGGRTFVLTTTLRALPQVAEILREGLDAAGASHVEVLVQGREPKRALMQRFLARPASVLVGSQSFWEGIDVPGDALQCVIIDKLPFPPPNDPIIEARVKRLEAEGRSAFDECFVAEAAVSLKQGAGRLVRSESDRGLLVVCDPRLARMPYGRRLIAALPPMTRVEGEEEALAWLADLAASH
jgi:ATP-dependent DNA helicase DinG